MMVLYKRAKFKIVYRAGEMEIHVRLTRMADVYRLTGFYRNGEFVNNDPFRLSDDIKKDVTRLLNAWHECLSSNFKGA